MKNMIINFKTTIVEDNGRLNIRENHISELETSSRNYPKAQKKIEE